MHSYLNKRQLKWLAHNEGTVRFRTKGNAIKITVKAHGEKLHIYSTHRVSDVKRAVDQVITTIEFFTK